MAEASCLFVSLRVLQVPPSPRPFLFCSSAVPSFCLAAPPALQPCNRLDASALSSQKAESGPQSILWPRPSAPPPAPPRPSPVLGSTVKWCSPSSTLYTSRALLPYVGSSASEAITCITDVPGPGGPSETGSHLGLLCLSSPPQGSRGRRSKLEVPEASPLTVPILSPAS